MVIEIFLNLKDYSEAVAAYGNGASLPDCMPDNRNWVLHRLLSLPCAGATGVFSQLDLLSQDFHSGKLCLEVCHLTAIMYCIHATFPVPRSMYGRQLLQLQMKESISKIHLTTGEQELGELSLWCVIIGGIAASGHLMRSWFTLKLFSVSNFLGLTQWSDAKGVLRKFACLDSACDQGGVTDMSHDSERSVSLSR